MYAFHTTKRVYTRGTMVHRDESGKALCIIMIVIIVAEVWVFCEIKERTFAKGQIQKIDSVEINRVPMQIISFNTSHGDCTAIMQSNIRKYELNDMIRVTIPNESGECYIKLGWFDDVLHMTLLANVAIIYVVCALVYEYCIGRPTDDEKED